MPLYDYRCRSCGERYEALVPKGGTAACPRCGAGDPERLVPGAPPVQSRHRLLKAKAIPPAPLAPPPPGTKRLC